MITQIDSSRSVAALIKDFGAMQQKQVPFAIRLAFQRTAEEGRDAARQAARRGLIIRSAGFDKLLANAIIMNETRNASEQYGGKRFSVEARSRIGKSRSLLPWLEDAGARTSIRSIGQFGSAVAVPVRGGATQVIPKNLYPSATGLGGTTFTIPQRPATGVQRGSRGQVIGSVGTAGRMRGKKRTFIIVKPGGMSVGGTIFQRTGDGDRDIRPLFLVRKQVRVRGRQYFFTSVEKVVRDRLAINFQGAMQAALWSTEVGRSRGVNVSKRGLTPHPTRAW